MKAKHVVLHLIASCAWVTFLTQCPWDNSQSNQLPNRTGGGSSDYFDHSTPGGRGYNTYPHNYPYAQGGGSPMSHHSSANPSASHHPPSGYAQYICKDNRWHWVVASMIRPGSNPQLETRQYHHPQCPGCHGG